MENYQIDCDKLTMQDAQRILNMICNYFDVWATCWHVKDSNQVACLKIDGPYTNEIKQPKKTGN